MSIQEKLTDAKELVSEKVTETVDKYGDRVTAGVDKAADFVDEKTKGKYSDRISSVAGVAKSTVEKLGSDEATPPPAEPPVTPTDPAGPDR